MEKEISIFVPEDKKLLQRIYENVDELIKDSDNNAEKQIVKNYLQTLSQRLELAVIGKSGSGKTTLLNKLLHEELLRGEELKPTIGIREYRGGAEERVYRLENEHWRVFSCSQVLQGLAVYDSQGMDTISENGRKKLRDIVKKCAITLVMLSADSIRDYSVWNFVEKIDCKHMVFIQTKCDLVTKEECERNTVRIKQYLSEIGINAPVFNVTDMITPDGEFYEGYAQLSQYISDNIIGEDPILTNQYNNITSLKGMLEELNNSLEVRKKQYLADKYILEKINAAVDTFRVKNCNTVEWLKKDLSQVIEAQIDEYQNEIIKKLDPKQIKERFLRGSNDFITYIEFVNETYRGRMTEQINRKTQRAICKYLEQMEIVFEEAVGYLKSRESLISLEDKFYGSLSESKSTMIRQATGEVQAVCTYCNTLTNASEELFMKIWNARNSYDNKVMAGEVIGGGAGGVVGGIGTVFITKVMGAAPSAVATATSAVGLWPLLGALVGAAVIAALAKTIVSAKSEGDMLQKVNQCICKFKEEVQQTKSQMIRQILATVDEIFRNELEMADKAFVDFRKSVNVDSCKIPLLEETFETTQSLIKKLETMKDGF